MVASTTSSGYSNTPRMLAKGLHMSKAARGLLHTSMGVFMGPKMMHMSNGPRTYLSGYP